MNIKLKMLAFCAALLVFVQNLRADVLADCGDAATAAITAAVPIVGGLLVAALGVVVGFVGFKLVKRALNKA